jgi:DNA-binding CsgD family transcriptional regulator
MIPAGISSNFPTRFQRESLNLVARLLPLSSSAFYLVGPDMQHRGVVLRNLDAAAERKYVDTFAELDPLNPALFAATAVRVAAIDEQLPEAELLASRYYLEFMAPLGHRHVADMFLRRGGDIVAVLSMLREPALGSFSARELALLRELQPFLEYTLNSVYLPKRLQQRAAARNAFALTERELDVLELLVAGASNKLIARELGLSLATVKTHVSHIFRKAGATSRTELSARVLSGDGGESGA